VKRSSLCATSVAGPLVVLLLAAGAGAQAPAPAGPRPANAAAPVMAGTNVAVIDIAYLFKNHVRFNAQRNDLKKDLDAFDAYVRAEQQKLNTKREALQQFNPSSAEYKKAEEELAHLQSDLQVKIGLKRKEFLEQEARIYYNTYKEVEQAVAVFAQKYRIGLVLRYSSDEIKPDDPNSVMQGVTRPVVYQDRLDITEHILAELNRGATMPGPSPGVAPGLSGAAPSGAIAPGTPTAARPTAPVIPQRPPGVQQR
jgi:Skp family chaperone for outer membrane proteins